MPNEKGNEREQTAESFFSSHAKRLAEIPVKAVVLLKDKEGNPLNPRRRLTGKRDDSDVQLRGEMNVDDLIVMQAGKPTFTAIQPITVVDLSERDENGNITTERYGLLNGDRRIMASKLAKNATIIANVIDGPIDDDAAVDYMLLTDQSRNFNTLAKALVVADKHKVDPAYYTIQRLSELTGVAPSTVETMILLAEMEPSVQQAVAAYDRDGGKSGGYPLSAIRQLPRGPENAKVREHVSKQAMATDTNGKSKPIRRKDVKGAVARAKADLFGEQVSLSTELEALPAAEHLTKLRAVMQVIHKDWSAISASERMQILAVLKQESILVEQRAKKGAK